MPNYDLNKTYNAQTTTDNFTDLQESLDLFKTPHALAIILENTGANSLDWKLLASNDDSTYVEVQSSSSLASGNTASFTKQNPEYRYYKVQIKATSGGSQTDAVLSVTAK